MLFSENKENCRVFITDCDIKILNAVPAHIAKVRDQFWGIPHFFILQRHYFLDKLSVWQSRQRAMFWKYNSAGGSQIDTVLEKEDLTLKEVRIARYYINLPYTGTVISRSSDNGTCPVSSDTSTYFCQNSA